MSYCRFSSDDYQCDVYCYQDICGGYTTHVAESRFVFKEELPPKVPIENAAWFARYQKINEMVKQADRKRIGLPFDGHRFNDEDAESCAKRLQQLKDLGYKVPQYAIEELQQEWKDECHESANTPRSN